MMVNTGEKAREYITLYINGSPQHAHVKSLNFLKSKNRFLTLSLVF